MKYEECEYGKEVMVKGVINTTIRHTRAKIYSMCNGEVLIVAESFAWVKPKVLSAVRKVSHKRIDVLKGFATNRDYFAYLDWAERNLLGDKDMMLKMAVVWYRRQMNGVAAFTDVSKPHIQGFNPPDPAQVAKIKKSTIRAYEKDFNAIRGLKA